MLHHPATVHQVSLLLNHCEGFEVTYHCPCANKVTHFDFQFKVIIIPSLLAMIGFRRKMTLPVCQANHRICTPMINWLFGNSRASYECYTTVDWKTNMPRSLINSWFTISFPTLYLNANSSITLVRSTIVIIWTTFTFIRSTARLLGTCANLKWVNQSFTINNFTTRIKTIVLCILFVINVHFYYSRRLFHSRGLPSAVT